MMIAESRILFTGDKFVIAKIWDLLPRHRNFPRGAFDVFKPWNNAPAVNGAFELVRGRKINRLYCHQTAGSVKHAYLEAPTRTARFQTNDPGWVYEEVNGIGKWVWTGTGRGWPGICYTWFIPWVPLTYCNKIVIFQCNELDWITWHSSHNANSVAIVCQGYFRSRHMRSFKPMPGCPGKPNDKQIAALTGFIQQYAIDTLGISPGEIKGHCDSPRPKLACPGDDIEAICRRYEHTQQIQPWESGNPQQSFIPGMVELATWKDRQAALRLIGHYIGSTGSQHNGVDGDPGELTRLAIEAQESLLGMVVDGYWDDAFDFYVKTILLASGYVQGDLDALK